MLLRRELMISVALVAVFTLRPPVFAINSGNEAAQPAESTTNLPVSPNVPIPVIAGPTGNFMNNPPANLTAIDASNAPTDPNFAGQPSTSNTVDLEVDATSRNPLHYRWRVTDGNVVDVDAPATTWTLAAGPGIHFAYVLVSDGLGGYSEGRIAVNTDENPSSSPVPKNVYTMPTVVAEPPTPRSTAATQIIGQVILGDVSTCGVRNPFFGVNVNAVVELFDANNVPLRRFVLDPYSPIFAVDDEPTATMLSITCEGATAQFTNFTRSTVEPGGVTDVPRNIFILPGTQRPAIQSVTATQNGKSIGYFPLTPTVRLPSDFLIGRLGDKLIGPPAHFLAYKGLDSRKGSCEYYKAIGVIGGCDDFGNFTGPSLTFTQWRQESRIAEFAKFANLDVSAVFINKLDLNLTRDHHGVEYNHDDVSAYVCNHPGPAPDPAPSPQNPTATGTDPTGLFSTPDRVDAAIEDVTKTDSSHPQGRNLLACVAMDRRPVISVANGQRIRTHLGDVFTRFLIFGPDGELLPSVNLDGQGEKFVPGACVACHGGTKYFGLAGTPSAGTPNLGGFPEVVPVEPGFPDFNASQVRDLGAYFLPFDVENLQFHSTRAGLTEPDEDFRIRILNGFVRDADDAVAAVNRIATPGATTRFDTLFHGFYPNSGGPFAKGSHVAPAYTADQDSRDFYLNVVARSCRTCHIAMDDADFENSDPIFRGTFPPFVCDASLAAVDANNNPTRFENTIFTGDANLAYVMPNSRVTFDRFWLSDRPNVAGQPAETVSQPEQTRVHVTNKRRSDGALIAQRCFLPPP
jgi:hypothetical protein